MNKKSMYAHLSAVFALCVPAPGRFACGVVLAAELLLLMLAGTLARGAVKKLGLAHTGAPVVLAALVSAVMLVRQALAFFAPVLALQLGFVMYLPAVSTFMLGVMFGEEQGALRGSLLRNALRALRCALFALAFFLFRDVAGFGTITFPTLRGISERVLFDSSRATLLTFFATIPGAVVLAAVVLICCKFAAEKIAVVENADGGLEMEAADA